MRPGMYRVSLFRSAAIALGALAGLSTAAVAQSSPETSGKKNEVVVVNVHTTSTTQTMGNRMMDLAKYLGIGGNDVGEDLDDILGLLSAVIKRSGFVSGPMAKHIGDRLGDFQKDLTAELTDPEPSSNTESMGYTIYITPGQFRVHAGQIEMVWHEGQMWVTDPETGQMMGRNLAYVDNRLLPEAEHTGAAMTVSRASGSPEMHAGYIAYPHEYSFEMELDVLGVPGGQASGQGLQVSVVNEVSGTAWISTEVPEHAQIAAFYRNFASAFGNQQGMMGGQAASMVRLTELGVPLRTNETAETFLVQHGDAGGRMLVVRGTSDATVTEISSIPLEEVPHFGEEPPRDPRDPDEPDEELPPRDPDEPEPCDCSCGAFEALKELEDDDPEALAKAMCAQECAMKWAMQCQE